MGFVKRGDAEVIKIIENSVLDDQDTESALQTIKRDAKNSSEDGNKNELTIEGRNNYGSN